MASHLLTAWNPEDRTFWETSGKAIATRNLWISSPAILAIIMNRILENRDQQVLFRLQMFTPAQSSEELFRNRSVTAHHILETLCHGRSVLSALSRYSDG